MITVTIEEQPSNDCYKKLLKNRTLPIFVSGDNITGSCTAVKTTDKSIKHRGFFLNLVGRYYNGDEMIKEVKIQQQQIFAAGKIREKQTIPFSIIKPKFQAPSYHGFKLKLIYSVDIIVSRTFRADLSQSAQFIVLDPYPHPVPSNPFSQTVAFESIHFDVKMEKSNYSTDELIKGKINFASNEPEDLKSVSLVLIVIEKLTDMDAMESEIFNYDLIDGAPKPNSSLPFYISLKPYAIWALNKSRGKDLDISFKIEIRTNTSEKENVTAGKFFVYQRVIK